MSIGTIRSTDGPVFLTDDGVRHPLIFANDDLVVFEEPAPHLEAGTVGHLRVRTPKGSLQSWRLRLGANPSTQRRVSFELLPDNSGQ